ncbi:hypothetical protein [Stutzerimonas nitrititolerans]|uniref:hypothetical protein n=1 Tax=Stutzerimonas nitrititolerans TaxID=2482751 RepID=UPI002899E574|nr:hypothetical protein [Stutzerimonas nitrititolerans]
MNYMKLATALLMGEPPRSAPFREGLGAVLQNRVEQTPVNSPYPEGSIENDAFFAGRMRAHNEFRNALEEFGGDHDAAVARLRRIADDRRTA